MIKQKHLPYDRLNLKLYFQNKAVRDKSTFVYSQNKAFYELNGVMIPAKTFDELYPTAMAFIDNNKGLDPRSNFY